MDLQPQLVKTVRSLATDYVAGIIWICDATLFVVGFQVKGVISAASAAAQVAGKLKIPEPATVFLLAVMGVLLPYALAVAFRPIGHSIAIFLIKPRRRREGSWWRFKQTEEKPFIPVEHVERAVEVARNLLGVNTEVGGAWTEAFGLHLEHSGTPMMDRITDAFEVTRMRSGLVLPASILLALLVYISLPPNPSTSRLILSVAVFLVFLSLFARSLRQMQHIYLRLILYGFLVERSTPNPALLSEKKTKS